MRFPVAFRVTVVLIAGFQGLVVCRYAHAVDSSELIRDIRQRAGLSIRELAERSGVAASTITRIQAGAVDPSIGTLDRLVETAGFRLRLTAIGGVDRRVADLVDAWSYRRNRLRLDWPRWRTFLDHLEEISDVEAAISVAPQPSGIDVVDNLIAAIAERVADENGSDRPHWTTTIAVLDEPYLPPIARPGLDRPVPVQLAERGLTIDTDSLWRRKESTGS